jgi:DNA-binding response OmpR family regulator
MRRSRVPRPGIPKRRRNARLNALYNRTVNTQVMRLWRKLESDSTRPRYICTERGVGYVFSVPVETVY